MKNISEMQLDDIRAVYKRLDMLNEAGTVAWQYTEALFSSSGQFQILCDLKMKLLVALRARKEAGTPLQDELFSLSDFKGKAEEDILDDWDDVYEGWRNVSEQMERLYISAMEEAGFRLVGNWAAQAEIMGWLSGDDNDDLYEAFLCGRMDDGTDIKTYIREHFGECFYEYDREKQFLDAMEFATMNSCDVSACEFILAFRSDRIGRILSYIMEHGVVDPIVDVLRDLLEETARPLNRYISFFAHPYVSDEDGAYVVRMAVGRYLESGEEIDFALFRPVILMYLPLITRLCTLLEERYPQILTKEVQDHEKRCA